MQTAIAPKRAVHLDFHTMPGIYDVGRDFDAEAFARTLEEAHVDYITVFARCNLGFAHELHASRCASIASQTGSCISSFASNPKLGIILTNLKPAAA